MIFHAALQNRWCFSQQTAATSVLFLFRLIWAYPTERVLLMVLHEANSWIYKQGETITVTILGIIHHPVFYLKVN
jgi:hypothetical protein